MTALWRDYDGQNNVMDWQYCSKRGTTRLLLTYLLVCEVWDRSWWVWKRKLRNCHAVLLTIFSFGCFKESIVQRRYMSLRHHPFCLQIRRKPSSFHLNVFLSHTIAWKQLLMMETPCSITPILYTFTFNLRYESLDFWELIPFLN